MSVLKRRHRLVTFRVANDEFQAIEASTVASGSRSISEFARLAVLRRASVEGAPRGLLSEDLTTLSGQLSELDITLRDLRAQIRKVLGSVQPENNTGSQASSHAGGLR